MTTKPPLERVFLYNAEAIETTISTRSNHCLLRALAHTGVSANQKDAAAIRRLRERIAKAVLERRDLEHNSKTLEAWVEADSPGMRIDIWAEQYKTSDMMSDQIVLRMWPLPEGEAVWLWLPVLSAGYELLPAHRFDPPPGAHGGVRHVVYHADELHDNALTLQLPVLRRAEARAAASSLPVGLIYMGGCEMASKRRTSPPTRTSTPTNHVAILDHVPRIDASVDVPPTMTLPPLHPCLAFGLSLTVLKRYWRRLRNTAALATLERRACRARVAAVLCRWRARTWHAQPELLASRRAAMWRTAGVRPTRTYALKQWGAATADSQPELMSRLRICLSRWMELLVLVKPLSGSTRQLALPRRATFATLAARLLACNALPEALLCVKHNGKLLFPGVEVRLRRDDELRVELRAPLRGGMQRDDHGEQYQDMQQPGAATYPPLQQELHEELVELVKAINLRREELASIQKNLQLVRSVSYRELINESVFSDLQGKHDAIQREQEAGWKEFQQRNVTRVRQLQGANDSGAQRFADLLAKELRRMYDDRVVERPSRETVNGRGEGWANSFHAHIETALDNLPAEHKPWEFNHESCDGANLLDYLGRPTNPDFVANERAEGSGKAVIEAKFALTDSGSLDRYKGQQDKYLSSHCECVILLVYQSATVETLRETLIARCVSPGAHAVAIAVIFEDGEVDLSSSLLNIDDMIDEEDRDPAEYDVDGGGTGLDADDGSQLDASLSSDSEYIDYALPDRPHPRLRWKLDKLNKTTELKELWDLVFNPDNPAGQDCLDKCFFDVPAFMLEMYNNLMLPQGQHYVNTCPPEMFAGGSTQMGKTMFVVIGVLVAKKLGCASIVVTHKISGRNSLAMKICETLDHLFADRVPGAWAVRCMQYSSKADSQTASDRRCAFLKEADCIVASDTCYQLEASSKGSLYNLVRKLQADRAGPPIKPLRFVLFKDECDAFLRTAYPHRKLELEKALLKLETSRGDYHGSQLTVNISATLMPVLLKMAREKKEPNGQIFFTAVPKEHFPLMEYCGVDQFQPMIDEALAKVAWDDESDDSLAQQGQEPSPQSQGDHRVFLPASFSKSSSTLSPGWNEQVEAIYEDLCTRKGTQRGLLLDVSLMRVYVEPSIFGKALEAQILQKNLNVMVYYGKGGAVRLSAAAKSCVEHRDFGCVIGPLFPDDAHDWPTLGCFKDAELHWVTTQDDGKLWKPDCGRVIGPYRCISRRKELKKSRRATAGEILAAMEHILERLHLENDPIAVFGYSMMARGESFVSDLRVPSHLVLSMGAGASIDLLVQTAGRATFQRLPVLQRNGWSTVTVLMSKLDFEVLQAYPKLLKSVDDISREGVPLATLFNAESPLFRLGDSFQALHETTRVFGSKKLASNNKVFGQERSELPVLTPDQKVLNVGDIVWLKWSAGHGLFYECKIEQKNASLSTTSGWEYKLTVTEDGSETGFLALDWEEEAGGTQPIEWALTRERVPLGEAADIPTQAAESGPPLYERVRSVLKEKPTEQLNSEQIFTLLGCSEDPEERDKERRNLSTTLGRPKWKNQAGWWHAFGRGRTQTYQYYSEAQHTPSKEGQSSPHYSSSRGSHRNIAQESVSPDASATASDQPTPNSERPQRASAKRANKAISQSIEQLSRSERVDEATSESASPSKRGTTPRPGSKRKAPDSDSSTAGDGGE